MPPRPLRARSPPRSRSTSPPQAARSCQRAHPIAAAGSLPIAHLKNGFRHFPSLLSRLPHVCLRYPRLPPAPHLLEQLVPYTPSKSGSNSETRPETRHRLRRCLHTPPSVHFPASAQPRLHALQDLQQPRSCSPPTDTFQERPSNLQPTFLPTPLIFPRLLALALGAVGDSADTAACCSARSLADAVQRRFSAGPKAQLSLSVSTYHPVLACLRHPRPDPQERRATCPRQQQVTFPAGRGDDPDPQCFYDLDRR